VADDKTPRCPHCGARNPHGTACQAKKVDLNQWLLEQHEQDRRKR